MQKKKTLSNHPALYDKTSKAYKDVKKEAKDIGKESRFIFVLVFPSFPALLLMYLLTN